MTLPLSRWLPEAPHDPRVAFPRALRVPRRPARDVRPRVHRVQPTAGPPARSPRDLRLSAASSCLSWHASLATVTTDNRPRHAIASENDRLPVEAQHLTID